MLIINPELIGNSWIRPELAREEARLNSQAGASAAASSASASPAPSPAGESENFWGEDGFGFDDFLDLINPLQHLPVVGSIYRAVTGDEAAPGARIFGGALFGGPIGLASAVVDSAVEESSGKSMAQHVAALFAGDDQADDVQRAPDQETQVAAVAKQPSAAPSENREAASTPSKRTASGTMPTLSPQAFAALMSAKNAHGDDETGAEAKATANTRAGSTHAGGVPPTQVPGDLAQRMMDALDRYQAMKQADRAAAGAS